MKVLISRALIGIAPPPARIGTGAGPFAVRLDALRSQRVRPAPMQEDNRPGCRSRESGARSDSVHGAAERNRAAKRNRHRAARHVSTRPRPAEPEATRQARPQGGMRYGASGIRRTEAREKRYDRRTENPKPRMNSEALAEMHLHAAAAGPPPDGNGPVKQLCRQLGRCPAQLRQMRRRRLRERNKRLCSTWQLPPKKFKKSAIWAPLRCVNR